MLLSCHKRNTVVKTRVVGLFVPLLQLKVAQNGTWNMLLKRDIVIGSKRGSFHAERNVHGCNKMPLSLG